MINQYSGWKKNAEILQSRWKPNMSIIEIPGSHLILLTVMGAKERLDLYLMELTSNKRDKIGHNLTLKQLEKKLKIIKDSTRPVMLR